MSADEGASDGDDGCVGVDVRLSTVPVENSELFADLAKAAAVE